MNITIFWMIMISLVSMKKHFFLIEHQFLQVEVVLAQYQQLFES